MEGSDKLKVSRGNVFEPASQPKSTATSRCRLTSPETLLSQLLGVDSISSLASSKFPGTQYSVSGNRETGPVIFCIEFCHNLIQIGQISL